MAQMRNEKLKVVGISEIYIKNSDFGAPIAKFFGPPYSDEMGVCL